MPKYSSPLLNTLLIHPLAAITALSLPEYDARSSARQSLGILVHLFFSALLQLHQVMEMSVQPCSNLVRDVQSDSSMKSGLATPGLPESDSEALDILAMHFRL